MRITQLQTTPFDHVDYWSAAPGGGSESRRLPLLRGKISGLPESVDALWIAADLQGVAPVRARAGANGLLGEALAERIELLAEDGGVPAMEKSGIVLAGDLFSSPNATVRGATGDVRSVWLAFAKRFRWAVGAPGNHDTFGDTHEERSAFFGDKGVAVLDSGIATVDGIRFGGVGRVIGNASKPGRRTERDFLRAMRDVLADPPSLLVMHHGPDVPERGLRGHAEIRRQLEQSQKLLVVCGHVHWKTPLAELRRDTQVLNVDGRAILFERD